MHIAYLDTSGLLIGYGEAPSAVNGPAGADAPQGAASQRVFAVKPDLEVGQYYWDTLAGQFISIHQRPKQNPTIANAITQAALLAKDRGDTLPPEMVALLESLTRPTSEIPGL